jgi:poly(hydroxyalkanoate) granule-associated protein
VCYNFLDAARHKTNSKPISHFLEAKKMAKTEETVQEETIEEGNSLTDMARKVMLATIGAVALAQEEAEAFIKKLIERGEIAEKDGHKMMDDLKEKRQKKTKEAEDELDSRVTKILERTGVPTRADIEALSDKITALTKKIDELKETQS